MLYSTCTSWINRGLSRSTRKGFSKISGGVLFLLRKLYKPLSAKPADDCSYWNYELWPQPMAKDFLSPAALEVTGLTGKEKFENVPAWSWSLFLLGSSLRTLRALREENFFIFCSCKKSDDGCLNRSAPRRIEGSGRFHAWNESFRGRG
jgi:hypothetical protein